MFIHESFETAGSFTLLRPIFITILVASLILFFAVIIPKFNRRLLNGFSVITLTFLMALITMQLLYFTGIIVDELNLGGDATSSYMGVGIIGLNLASLMVYFMTPIGKIKEPSA